MAYAIYFFLLQIMNYKITTILLTVLSVILLATTIYYTNNQKVVYDTVTQNDTIVIKSIDTITIEKAKIIYRDVHILDTIFVKDTSLFVEQKVYCDSISTIYISGVKPEIDSIEYRIPKDTVQIYTEKIQTVKEKDNFFKNRFVVTAGVYAGYGLLNRKPDIYVGLGFGIRIY